MNHVNIQVGAGKDDGEKAWAKELKVAIMMAYLVIIVIVVYSLMLSVNTLSYAGGRGVALKYRHPIPEFTADYIWLEGVQIGAVAVMAAINPVIYHWKSPEFRSAFRKMLGCPLDKVQDSYNSGSDGSQKASSKGTTDTGLSDNSVDV